MRRTLLPQWGTRLSHPPQNQAPCRAGKPTAFAQTGTASFLASYISTLTFLSLVASCSTLLRITDNRITPRLYV